MAYGAVLNGQEVIKDECWIFDIVFACNMRTTLEDCEECRYKEVCDKFQMCFEMPPDLLWSKMSSNEYLLKCIYEWGEYQNEQTFKQ